MATYQLRVVESRVRETLDVDVRLSRSRNETVRTAALARDILAPFMADEATETVWVLMLDVKFRPLAVQLISRGSLSTSIVHPREVFGPIIRNGAAIGFILAHNHPSGDPEPSPEDIALTQRLIKAGSLLGIPILDHVIIGANGSYTAMRQRPGINLDWS